MDYTPTVWETGDTVTKEKMNKLEGGVAAAYPLVATATEAGTLDKTWNEMHEAMESGRIVMVLNDTNAVYEQEISLNMVCHMYYDLDVLTYKADMLDGNFLITLIAEDPDDPPHFPLG